MLYTTYISKIKKIPDGHRKIIVMRYMPNSLKDPKYNLEWMPDLAPSELLLNRYKSGDMSFYDFKESFATDLTYMKAIQGSINDVKRSLDNGEDVYLICCEKDSSTCHRTILKQHFETLGYKGEEM